MFGDKISEVVSKRDVSQLGCGFRVGNGYVLTALHVVVGHGIHCTDDGPLSTHTIHEPAVDLGMSRFPLKLP